MYYIKPEPCYLARALVLTDVLPPFFKVEWTVAQPTGAEEQLFQK
jgi:hypothetical protein